MLLRPTRSPRALFRVSILIAAALGAATAAVADDRELLRGTAANPYAFFILDTSGSMHYVPPCSERDDILDIDPWDGQCTRECVLDPATCEQFDPGPVGNPADWDPADPEAVKCVEFNVQYDGDNPPTLNEIILDEEGSAPEVDVKGSWTFSSNTPRLGSRRLEDTSGDGTKAVAFTPTIPETGWYHLYMFYEADEDDQSQNTLLTVRHADGIDYPRADQSNNNQVDVDIAGGFYNFIGTYRFEAGTTGSIEISNFNASDKVVVDSIRLLSVSRPSGLACLRTGYRHRQPLCPRGDCPALAAADDPTSKFFQIREAVFEVLKQTPDVQYGFGTYEQDDGRVQGKHWAYRLPETVSGTRQPFFSDLGPDIPDFPVPGTINVFGQGPPYNSTGSSSSYGWRCDNRSGSVAHPEGALDQVGCQQGRPADADDPWEMERARRISKLGPGNLRQSASYSDTHVYYRDPRDTAVFNGGQIYRATFRRVSGKFGDPTMRVSVILRTCRRGFGQNPNCNQPLAGTVDVTRTFTFELVTDFVTFQRPIGRDQQKETFYFDFAFNVIAQFSGSSTPSFNTGCNGLEPNDDRNIANGSDQDDIWYGYTFKWDTTPDPDMRGTLFDVGDFIPLDWDRNNQELIMGRMAPNLYDPTTGVFDSNRGEPDFRTAVYWADTYLDGDNPTSSPRMLRLKEDKQASMMPFGATPLANSLLDFRDWWTGSPIHGGTGFADVASKDDGDPLWGCRDNYVIFLTDGNETCQGNPCTAAKALFDLQPEEEQVLTYVVGFGLDDSTSNLGCIADEGGTGDPILPRNKQELVDALRDIFREIQATPVTFSSASVPAVQSASADKIYTSSFVPLPDLPLWPGEINAFRRPLPLKSDNTPDTDLDCGGTRNTGCFLWDAGEELVEQAPSQADLETTPPDYHIGDGLNERRVFYSVMPTTNQRPAELTLFRPPTNSPDVLDLRNAMLPSSPNIGADLEDEVIELIQNVLVRKQVPAESEIQDLFGDQTEFVMGDVFHSDPLVVETPDDFRYFSNDQCGLIQDDNPNNCVPGQDRGYRQFAQRHVWRRRMLTAATNDGQLHFFDVGVRKRIVVTLDDGQRRTVDVLTDGTGKELFSYMPRLTLPIVGEQFDPGNSKHIFSLDGSPSTGDVFIDPMTDATGAINPAEREWRTVLIAGLRRGGVRADSALPVTGFYPGYFALDITQPDVLVDEDGTVVKDPRSQDLDEPPVPQPEGQTLPGCLQFNYGGAGRQTKNGSCPYPFPMELWTFNDACYGSVESPSDCSAATPVVPPAEIDPMTGLANPLRGIEDLLNEDRDIDGDGVVDNNEPDLGLTFSQPIIGQIAICEPMGTACNPDDPANDHQLTSKFVAIHGGGIDPENKAAGTRGNWLYMVDIETGQAIYKRRLEGAAPSRPAVVDTDRDGLLDLIYIGTTEGILYKVDLNRKRSDGNLPGLSLKDDITDMIGRTHTFLRVDDDGAWEPDAILETWDDAPIYHPPAVFFIPEIDAWGVALGTGDREDLTDNTTDFEGRFYVFVDGVCNQDTDGDGDTDVLVTDNCLQGFNINSPPRTITLPNGDEVLDPSSLLVADNGSALPGWFMAVPDNFRMVSPPFLTFGVLIFSMFNGEVAAAGNNLCGASGSTFTFVVQAENANPLAQLTNFDGNDANDSDPGEYTAEDRYIVPEPPEDENAPVPLTTPPFVETTANEQPTDDPAADGSILSADQALSKEILNSIQKLFPRGSRFNPVVSKLVVLQLSDGSPAVRIPVPIGVYPADWGEP